MNKDERKRIAYSALLLSVLCIIGVSYAWFRLYLSQSENNRIASRTCFNTTLTEKTSKIDLTGAVAINRLSFAPACIRSKFVYISVQL